VPDFIEAIPTKEQFKADVFPIFPDGDLNSAYNELVRLLEIPDKKDDKGRPLVWSYILMKFKKHHDQWNFLYGQRDQKYLKDRDRDKRQDIYDFLNKELWVREYEVHKGSAERNNYLFGKLPLNNLMAQLQNFRDGQKKA